MALQQWEYLTSDIYYKYKERTVSEKKGLFGHQEVVVESWPHGDLRGETLELGDLLAALGDEGWELVGAVVAEQFYWAYNQQTSGSINVPHRLYFKRPKA